MKKLAVSVLVISVIILITGFLMRKSELTFNDKAIYYVVSYLTIAEAAVIVLATLSFVFCILRNAFKKNSDY